MGSRSATSRRARWRVVFAFTVLVSFVFLHLGPCCLLQEAHSHDHGTVGQVEVAVVAEGDSVQSPLSDCGPAHGHRTGHAADDALCRATRTVDGFAWLAALLATAAVLVVATAALPLFGKASRPRWADRDPCRSGRLILGELCIARI